MRIYQVVCWKSAMSAGRCVCAVSSIALSDMSQVIVKNFSGAPIYLRDIAEIRDTVKERESFARMNGKNVVSLSVIKRSGENLINASEEVNKIVDELKLTEFPKNLDVSITGDLSIKADTSFTELVNSIVIGLILVMLVLMFFMGVTNAFFVALSVPLSMFVAFSFYPLPNHCWRECIPQLHGSIRTIIRIGNCCG